ncbi:MAG TPA: hypothetical protein PLT64_09325 [Syntrophales bacterium]|nr:hypothetical protein [Syntrophales bacterium]HOL60043.1 hypothetical protein [Syntrophales bacterium]
MVKGIDAQHMITQTYVAEKIQQVQQRQGDLQQRYFDIQLAEERRKQAERVKKSEESERVRMEEEEKEKEKEGRRGSKEHHPQSGDEGDEHKVDVKA